MWRNSSQKKSNNPLLELVLGGILQTARDAPTAVASLHLTDDSAGSQKLSLKTYLTGDTAPAVERRPWFFAQESDVGRRPADPLSQRDHRRCLDLS